MYENSEAEVQRILRLIETCPEDLRASAFEILLQGYVSSLLGSAAPKPKGEGVGTPPPSPPGVEWDTDIPSEVRTRLQAMAKRKDVPAGKVAALFDFTADPFTFAPLHVPGKSTTERTRKVALLVAARSFLATTRWVADWAEIKAMCTHQNCYDPSNFSAILRKAEGKVFKTVSVGTSVELSAEGTAQAEGIIADLAKAADAS